MARYEMLIAASGKHGSALLPYVLVDDKSGKSAAARAKAMAKACYPEYEKFDVAKILIDGKGTIIAGHTRYEAAKRLDMDKVPCIQVDDLTDEQIRAYRIADNKVAEASSWNDDVLRAEMDALKALDVDLTDTGFSEVELDGLLREVEDADFEEFFTEPVQQPPKAADAEQSAETQQSTQPESSQSAVPQQSGSKLIQCPHCGEWFET